MPKIENFDTHIKINGDPYAKNSVTYKVLIESDTIAFYYLEQRDQKILPDTRARFDDWTDLNDNPYTSFELLIDDLDTFLFDTMVSAIQRGAFGEQIVANLRPIFRGSFEFTVSNTELTTNIEENDGTITQAEAMAVCTTSSTIGGHAHLGSTQKGKYRAGMGAVMRWTMLIETAGASGAELYGGYVDDLGSSATFINGFTIGYNGTQFGVQRWSNDVLVEEVIQSAWDKPLLTGRFILDTSKINVYEIQFQYLGGGDIHFKIEDPQTGQLMTVHHMEYTNANIVPSIFNPNGHWTLHARNASAVNLVIKSSSYAFFIEGMTEQIDVHQPQFSSGIREKTGVTTEVAIFTIRNKTSYAGKTNFIDIELEHISTSIEASSANNLGSLRLVKNATLGGVPSFTDINTTDSVVDIDVAGTTVADGKEIFSVNLAGKNDREFENIKTLQIIIQPGDTITLAGLSANSATIDGDLLWKELF